MLSACSCQRRDELQIPRTERALECALLSGRLAPRSTLSEFWQTRSRAAEPAEQRLDGIGPVVQTGRATLGARDTHANGETGESVGTCG